MGSQRRKGGAPSGHRLTSRDWAILRLIAKVGFQTYAELRLGPIKEASRAHSWVVLKKLVDMGYLTEVKGDGDEIRGWSLAPKGAREFEKYRDNESWAVGSNAPRYRTSFRHDTILREIQSALSRSSVVQSWVPEQKLRQECLRRFHYLRAQDKSEKIGGLPDAILHMKSGGKNSTAALELELTQKSKRRLFRKFESHITNSEYDYVFYVVEGAPLLDRLQAVYEDVLENSARVKIERNQNGIYFVELSALRKNPLRAKFEGAEDSFSLQDLTG